VHVLVVVSVVVDGFWRIRVAISPFEGPAIEKLPALPEEYYFVAIVDRQRIILYI
jgi:hypothetical protein